MQMLDQLFLHNEHTGTELNCPENVKRATRNVFEFMRVSRHMGQRASSLP
jgi:hypothetical protein